MTSSTRSKAPIPFREPDIAAAPATPGVYFLSRGYRVIFIGVATDGTTIREQLLRHLRGEAGPCTRAASEFEYDSSPNPRALYEYYLENYGSRTRGLLPECNERD
jgi:hypothetical protein